MHGSKEVIVFHPRALGLTLETDSFRPEDFEKLGLIELVVLPKNEANAKNLASLCNHREYALYEMKGVTFRHRDCPRGAGCPILGEDWPADTCEFDIDAPFHLQQVFSEDSSRYYLLSSGMPLSDPRAIDVALSLMTSLSGPQGEISPKYDAPTPPKKNDWLPLGPIAGVLGAAAAALLLIGLLPMHWAQRRRRLALMLGLPSALIFMGYGLVFTRVAISLGVTAVNIAVDIGAPAAVAAILASWLVAKHFRAINPAICMLATTASCSPLIVLASMSRNARPDVIASSGPFFSYLFLFPSGLLVGVILALVIRIRNGEVGRGE